ncbi:MAG TPA: hypothetical protein VGL61_10835 [Kofleriaceae bacterium]|jgi:hypothetical protein
MANRIVIACLLAPASAFAQPAASSTPAAVIAPDPNAARVAPREAYAGNLRLSITCADTWVTPDDGLVVEVDGEPVASHRDNGAWGTYWLNGTSGSVWSPSDTGYLLAPGPHHVEVSAPGCAPAAFDVTAPADRALDASGRLAVTDDWLRGPAGAPDGGGITVGAMMIAQAPHGPEVNHSFAQTAAFDDHDAVGGFISLSRERRHRVLAFDLGVAGGPTSGTVQGTSAEGAIAPTQFTGTSVDTRLQLRAGVRVPLHSVALAAGAGLGAEVWFDGTSFAAGANPFAFTPELVDGSWYVPAWASATLKPSCNWGVEVIGQYDVHPTAIDNDGFAVSAGIQYQPSASCSDAPGVQVTDGNAL